MKSSGSSHERHSLAFAGRHQPDQKSIDLRVVIHESLALVAHDMRARQIEASVNLASNSCIITGDQVLLQQVLVKAKHQRLCHARRMPHDVSRWRSMFAEATPRAHR
jgi:hypothetical protein